MKPIRLFNLKQSSYKLELRIGTKKNKHASRLGHSAKSTLLPQTLVQGHPHFLAWRVTWYYPRGWGWRQAWGLLSKCLRLSLQGILAAPYSHKKLNQLLVHREHMRLKWGRAVSQASLATPAQVSLYFSVMCITKI